MCSSLGTTKKGPIYLMTTSTCHKLNSMRSSSRVVSADKTSEETQFESR